MDGSLFVSFFHLSPVLLFLVSLESIISHFQDKVCRDVITGQKLIALCITEPQAGSDVRNLKTTAVRQGDHYIVNGQKKFITNGMNADYFTVAVRTGEEGE